MPATPRLKPPRAIRTKMPKHSVECRAYRFAMDTTHAEEQALFEVLGCCWEIRNILVADREADRRLNRHLRETGVPVRYLDRAAQQVRVSELQKAEPRYHHLHSQVLQNICRRIDEGTKRWLESLKHPGERKVSPPGFIERKDYSSFTFPQCGGAIGIRGGRVQLSKVGSFKLHQHRKYRGTPKTLTIRFEQGQWWAVLVCALQGKEIYRGPAEVEHLPDTGGDPGLASLLTLADGTVFDPPKALKDTLTALRHAQRDLSRKFEHREARYEAEEACRKAAGEPSPGPLREVPYSHRLRVQIKRVAKLHTKADRVREYHHRKIARQVEGRYRTVAVEEHGVGFMLSNRKLARAASDRAIASLKDRLASVLGPRLIRTANRRPGIGGNSQTCLCGEAVPKGLGDRDHLCPACGLAAPRDVVSANIVMRIAFGRDVVQEYLVQARQSVAGQAIVRRGGAKGGAQSVSAESKGGSPEASEAPVKRQPQTSLRTSNTRGGEPTREAKSARISGKPLLLAEAHSLVSGFSADGKHRPSGR